MPQMNEVYVRYQVRILQDEIQFQKRRLAEIPLWIVTVGMQAQRFYWTLTRLLGLGHLHDGSRKASPAAPLPMADPETAPPPGRRTYLDVTSTAASPLQSGIQRVVRRLSAEGARRFGAVPVIAQHRKYVTTAGEPVGFAPGDRLLMIDSTWAELQDVAPATAAAKEGGAHVAFLIYDLIPVLYPGFSATGLDGLFTPWLTAMTSLGDTAIAISRDTALQYRDWARENVPSAAERLQIGWFHLGADFAGGRNGSPPGAPGARSLPSQDVGAFLRDDRLYFLSVGTVEPRKGHATVLDAFERRWSAGDTSVWVIAGRKGWNVEALQARIVSHPEFGKRLFWFDDASDADIAALYAKTRALIMASLAEGFGLPLVEAAQFHAPVIATDLPVFREIAGDQIDYFPALDPAKLADCIARATQGAPAAPVISELSWAEAATNLFRLQSDREFRSDHAGWLDESGAAPVPAR